MPEILAVEELEPELDDRIEIRAGADEIGLGGKALDVPVGRIEDVQDDEEVRLRLFQGFPQDFLGEKRMEQGHFRSDLAQGIEDDDGLRDVGGEERDDAFLSHAQAIEPVSHLVDAGKELPEGYLPFPEIEGDDIGVPIFRYRVIEGVAVHRWNPILERTR